MCTVHISLSAWFLDVRALILVLDGLKALHASQKTNYNDEDKFVHTSIFGYPVTRIYTACER